MKFKKTESGVTFFEILIGLSIAAITGLLLSSSLVQNSNLLFNQNSRVLQGTGLNNASSELNELLRSAQSVAVQYPLISPQYITGLSTMVLALPSLDSGGNIISNTYDYAVVTKDNAHANLLKKLVFPNSSPQSFRKSENKVLVSALSNLVFYYLDSNNLNVSPASAVKINYIINESEKAGKGNQTSSRSAQISLRNN